MDVCTCGPITDMSSEITSTSSVCSDIDLQSFQRDELVINYKPRGLIEITLSVQCHCEPCLMLDGIREVKSVYKFTDILDNCLIG